jgi:iron complex transport system ATP-binding protein
MTPTEATFATHALEYRYPGQPHPAIDGLTMHVPPGSVFALLGPNGSGKSTLFKLLLGALTPTAGEVRYRDLAVGRWPRRAYARHVGVVPQLEQITFPLTVRQLVSMGRYPHMGPWRSEAPADRQAIDQALARCEIIEFAERPLGTLSGGELQRARVARALAQEPDTLVLDEPTAALDIHHEMAMFELLAQLALRDGKTVVIATHNINLAARYATQVLLLDHGRPAAAGTPIEVIEANTIGRVYRWPVAIVQHPGPGPDTGAPQVVPLAGGGSEGSEGSEGSPRGLV